MITNSRLLELRATGLECQKRITNGTATHLEKEYATLFQLVLDGLPTGQGKRDPENNSGPQLNFLLGK